jgi:hypothetical protein
MVVKCSKSLPEVKRYSTSGAGRREPRVQVLATAWFCKKCFIKSQPHLFPVVYGCFPTRSSKVSICHRDFMDHSPNYLLCAHHCCRHNENCVGIAYVIEKNMKSSLRSIWEWGKPSQANKISEVGRTRKAQSKCREGSLRMQSTVSGQ